MHQLYLALQSPELCRSLYKAKGIELPPGGTLCAGEYVKDMKGACSQVCIVSPYCR